jgi:Trk-type K+ transport system membrane component
MKSLGYLGVGFAAFTGSILLSFVGHIWLPKSTLFWVLQLSGVGIVWVIAVLVDLLFAVWCINAAAAAKTQAEMRFNLLDIGQAIAPAVWVLVAIIAVNGIALWLL